MVCFIYGVWKTTGQILTSDLYRKLEPQVQGASFKSDPGFLFITLTVLWMKFLRELPCLMWNAMTTRKVQKFCKCIVIRSVTLCNCQPHFEIWNVEFSAIRIQIWTTFIIFHSIGIFYTEQDKSAEYFENIFIIVMYKNLVLDWC